MNNNVIVSINTKGGVGKSILSKYVLPAVLYKKGILVNVYEIDNSNAKSNFQSEFINYRLFKINEQNEALFDVSFNEDDTGVLSIVDVGGGDDVNSVLAALGKLKIANPKFIIPTNEDDDQFDNTQSTITQIKKYFKTPTITLLLNKVIDVKNPKEQFVNFFGLEKRGFPAEFPKIENDISSLCMVPVSTLFVILKNQYKTTLLDMYINAKDLVTNEHKYRQEWRETAKKNNDRSYYDQKLEMLLFANDVVEYTEELKQLLKDI